MARDVICLSLIMCGHDLVLHNGILDFVYPVNVKARNIVGRRISIVLVFGECELS